MSHFCWSKYCCFCCYQCERRAKESLLYKQSGKYPEESPQNIELQKDFRFQQAASVLQSAHHPPPPAVGTQSTQRHRPIAPVLRSDKVAKGEGSGGGTPQALLQFSLRYDLHAHTLAVLVRHVSNASWTEKCKCEPERLSIIFFLTPGKKEPFEARGQSSSGQHIVFDNHFTFAGLPVHEMMQKSIIFHVYYIDRSTKKRLLGTVAAPLNEADIRGNTITKEINRSEETRKEAQKSMAYKFGGEINLSLTYKPKLALLQGTMRRAESLRPNLPYSADPYVNVSLFHRTQLLAKWRSTIRIDTLSPVYDEQFQFDVMAMDISLVSIRIAVLSFDRLGRDKLIGSASIGNHSPSETGRQHWAAIQTYQNESITFWHALWRAVA